MRGCPVHCTIFSSIPHLHPLHASNNHHCLPSPYDSQKCLQRLSDVLCSTKFFPVENHWLRESNNSIRFFRKKWQFLCPLSLLSYFPDCLFALSGEFLWMYLTVLFLYFNYQELILFEYSFFILSCSCFIAEISSCISLEDTN